MQVGMPGLGQHLPRHEDRVQTGHVPDVEAQVRKDPREGGEGVFRWDDGAERRARVLVVEPHERLVLDWDEEGEGEVEFTLEEVEAGTRLLVRESTPQFSTALELRALALAYA